MGIGLLILGVVVVFNLGRAKEDQSWRVAPFTGLLPSGDAPQVGSPAPDFTLTLLKEGTFRLSEQRGKLVWLNFWATWCPPCRAEMPDIQKVWDEVEGQGVVLLAIDFAEDAPTVSDYMSRNGFTFPVGMDLRGVVSTEYRIAGLPTHIFIDKEGIVREIRTGVLSPQGMRGRLERLKGF